MDPQIVVGIIAGGAAILAALISGLTRRENRSDHTSVAEKLHELVGSVRSLERHNHTAHQGLHERLDDINGKVERHLDHHERNEGRWLGPERRSGGDRRQSTIEFDGPDRRHRNRRDADVSDL